MALLKWLSFFIGAIVGTCFGGWSIGLEVLIILTLFDYVTGIAHAAITGSLSSKVGYLGAMRKTFIFVIVAAAHFADIVTNQNLFMTATIFFYIANELLSILENAANIGVPIPGILKKALAILQEKGGSANE